MSTLLCPYIAGHNLPVNVAMKSRQHTPDAISGLPLRRLMEAGCKFMLSNDSDNPLSSNVGASSLDPSNATRGVGLTL